MCFLIYEFQTYDLIGMFLPSLKEESERKIEDHKYNNSLRYFAELLFYYCEEKEEIRKLEEAMMDNLIYNEGGTVVEEFFREILDLKLSREWDVKDSGEICIDYFDMDDSEVEYVLNKDMKIIDSIFTKEHIKMLEIHAKEFFDDDQKEGLGELIKHLENGKGIDYNKLSYEPKFQKLYYPRIDKRTF